VSMRILQSEQIKNASQRDVRWQRNRLERFACPHLGWRF